MALVKVKEGSRFYNLMLVRKKIFDRIQIIFWSSHYYFL